MALPEYYLLYRNGDLYEGSRVRADLAHIVASNPDFTEPDDGKMPVSEIVRYVPASDKLSKCGLAMYGSSHNGDGHETH